ncbi:MAG: S8 family serine peptidase, partial [Candidatus Thermoplasmatota archaeon]|nr:S8 family serine peptidase [Candidatus Thermoplasmatota archaeon]
DGHGTHVAGTALGTGGGSEHIGTAPGSGLVDVKVANSMGFTQQSRMIAAYEWCLDNRERHRISVVSVSMGSRDDSDGGGAECELVNKMVDSGIVFIAAIGNTGDRFVGAPASADKAIAVGAIDDMNTVSRDDDVIAAYSSFGPRKSGDSVESSDLKPEIVAPGTNIMAPKHNSMGAYVTMSGTSMATPMVSATAAMMLEANPFLSTDQIRNILTQTAERRGTATYPEIDQDWNYQYGWGMLDAHGAVSLAMETTPHPPNPTIPYVDRESVVVSWDEYMGTGFTSYSIHFNLADGGPATEETFSINNKTTTQQTITGLQEDTEYQLQVKYVTWSGELAGNTLFFTTNETGFIGSNQPPSAHIISITPSDSTEGETVHFQGYGEDVDGTVEEYRWSSSLDGLLSDQPEFFHSGLRPGYHTISFRVRDNRGEWSQEDTKRITVRDASGTIPDISQPSISITSPTQSQAIPREGVLEIRGTAHGSPQIVSVSIGIDNTSWVSVQSLVKTSDSEGETASWAHLISLESLPVGGHTIHVRVYDGTHASYAQVDFVLVEVEEPDQDGFFAMLQNPFCLVPALLIFLALILAIALVARKIKRYNTSSYKGPGQL